MINFNFSIHSYKLIKEIFLLNIVISLVALIGNVIFSVSLIFSLCVLIYLILESLKRPKRTIYIILGIKLTFDMLWYIKLPLLGGFSFGMLEVIFLPLLITFLRSDYSNKINFFFLFISFLLIYWQFAFGINGNLTIDGFFRSSGILIGLLCALILVRESRDFNLIVTCIFISTIFPVLLTFVQYILDLGGVEILFSKGGGVLRGKRLSGLYYDPATSGMVSLISIISGLYLIIINYFDRRYIYTIIAIAGFMCIIGQTRSILFISSLIFSIFFFKYISKSYKAFIIFVPILFYFGGDYINQVWDKSLQDIPSVNEVEFLLQDSDYSTLLTGRIGIWQNYWEKFVNATFIEKVLGHGYISGHSHNSYLGLLLHSGVLGLSLYLIFHFLVIIQLISSSKLIGDINLVSFFSILAILLIGFSATAVIYTSFQWIIYFIIGSQIILNNNSSRYA